MVIHLVDHYICSLLHDYRIEQVDYCNLFLLLMCTGEYEKRQGVIFKYSRTRKTENAIDMINDFNGMLISDAYVAYQNMDEVSSAFCWAHVRRYFVNSIPLDSKGKEVPGSKGNEGREYINKLFKIEDNASDLSLEKKLQKQNHPDCSPNLRNILA